MSNMDNVTVKVGPPVDTEVLEVPNFPSLTVKVYGKRHAQNLKEDMEQGYHVSKNGVPTARAELEADERAAVMALLREKYPEHAQI